MAEAQAGLVTVLFTDLVDSTSLMAALGPVAADELRRQHFQSLREAIAAFGGVEVKNVGDGLMATFERPSDGAACAVDMQRRTARLAARRNERLAVRVGLSVGEATREDGDWFGRPVVEAARLCASAAPSQILANDVLRALAHARRELQFVALGPLELKGLPGSVGVVEVAWEPAPGAGGALPPLLDSAAGVVLVGRDLEVDRLVAAWKESRAGRRQAVLIAGEPGIGKTRLARELAVTAHADGATVLYGRCDEETGIPYQPFVEALDPYVSACPIELLERHVAEWGGELARILVALERRQPGIGQPVRADAEIERHRLFGAVASLLASAAEATGAVLVLDDLHWADAATLLLLRHLLRSGDPLPLVVGTYRDTDLVRTHPLAAVLADLRRQDDVERINLTGLDEAGVQSFVEAAAGERLADDGIALARAVHTETEGNPFFVGQVLRHLAESGAIYQRDGHWAYDGDVAHLGIPEGVREVIGRRLSRLSEQTNVVLRTAAVVGREFALDVVAEVAELAEDVVIEALDEAASARLVVEVAGAVDVFSFTHALVRESLYDELSTSRRVRLHRRIGQVLERRPSTPVAVLAHHFGEAAATGEVDRAADYGLRAGQESMASLAHEDAAAHFRRALEVVDIAGAADSAVRVDLLVGLAGALDAGGDLDGARACATDAARIARAIDDRERFARAAVSAVVGVPWIVDDGVEALLREAVERLGASGGDDALRANVLGSLSRASSLIYKRGMAEREALSAEALALARRSGSDDALVFALACRHDAIWGPTNVEERLALANEMIEHEGGRSLGVGALYRLVGLCELGEIDGARGALADYLAAAERLRAAGVSTWGRIWTTTFLLFEGRLDEADMSLMGWFGDRRGILDDFAMQCFGVQFFDLRRAQGRCGEIEAALRPLVESHPEAPGWRCGLALLLSELDRREEVAEQLEGLAADDFATVLSDPARLDLHASLLAEACAYLGDGGPRARWLYDRLEPHAGRNIVVGAAFACIGAASRYLGLLCGAMERWDDAVTHFEDALAMNSRMGARPWIARTACDYAEVLKRSGVRSSRHPDELLDLAGSIADDIPLPLVAGKVAALRT